MPNIIEQQDLLKGLPDARLALLLKNPVGDIPPFLVAAEAQRRQAIRQQFSGGGTKESVVDTLTKQMARVPENIGSKETPTDAPDLKGILEKNKEIQDTASSQSESDQSQGMAAGGVVHRYASGGLADLNTKGTTYGFFPGAQTSTSVGALARASSVLPKSLGVLPGNIGYQAVPQKMNHGGIVQRYADGSLVQQMADRFKMRAPTVDELSTMSPEELSALREYQNPTLNAAKRLRADSQATGGRYGQGTTQQRELLENQISGPFSWFYPSESIIDSAKRLQELPTEAEIKATAAGSQPDPYAQAYNSGYRGIGVLPGAETSKEREQAKADREEMSRLKNVYQQYAESQPEAADKMRQQIEELYKYQEPSDWEKAQRWFAMSAQFLDPSKTTMQSLAGAANEFANAAAEDRRAKREAELTGKGKLLEYDINNAQRLQDAEQKRAEREWETKQKILERNQLYKSDAIKTLDTMITSLNDKISKATEAGPMVNSKYLNDLIAQRDAYVIQQAQIMKDAGYGPVAGTVTKDQLEAALKALQTGKQ